MSRRDRRRFTPNPDRHRPGVRNPTGPPQVRAAASMEEDQHHMLLAAVQALLAQPDGRLVLWELLVRAGIYRSVWDPSARIHYNAGRQDYGHELLGLIIEADEDLYQLMEREGRERQRMLMLRAVAAQRRSEHEGGDDGG